MMMAKDTRRVDILCYRVSLGQKLLHGTEKYQSISKIVDEAVKKLEDEVGPLTGLPVKMGRGIVNRLSSGPEVQRLCACALESLEKMISSTILSKSTTQGSFFNILSSYQKPLLLSSEPWMGFCLVLQAKQLK